LSEFVAGAFVDVRPDAKNFRSLLKRDVTSAVDKQGPIKIPVELDVKRLKSTINTAAKNTPAKIPVVTGTSVAALRKDIKDKIDKATTGLKITVPIHVESTTARAASGGAGGTATSAATVAATGTASTKKAAARATKELSVAEQQELAVARALKKADEELALAELLKTQATSGGIKADEVSIRLQESRAASTRAIKTINQQLATSEADLTDVQRSALQSKLAEAQATRIGLNAKKESAAANLAESKLITQNAQTRAKAAGVLSVEVKQINTLNQLHVVENELLSVEAKLNAQSAKARDLDAVAIGTQNKALLAQIQTQKAAIAQQRLLLKGQSAAARQQKTTARGFASTILSLGGIRGATLAASSAFLAGAVAAALFAKSLGSFAALEEQLNVFQATTGATNEQMQEVAKTARQLGADISLPGVSAADAASAMGQLARAGLSVRDSIAGARGVLELAAAAQISNAEAADLAASALNAFGLAGDQAVHVADLLANAANASQGSITEMAASLAQASAIARQVGFSLEDTVAILTQFARNGLKGSDAGTSLRTALSRLIAPTAKASDLIAALGLNLRDANGRLRADVFVQFGQATKNLTPALRDMIAETIAGQDAIRAFSIGAREGARGLKLAQLEMAATGTAAQLAGARSKGLGGEFRALSSNAETLGTSLGGLAAGPVKDLAGGLNQILSDLNLLASGDTGGFLKQLGDEFVGMGEGAKQSAGDVNDLLSGITDLDPGRFAKGAKGLLRGGLLQAPKDEENEIKNLREELLSLQNLRVNAFAQGINIKPLTDKIKQVQTKLREARVDAGELIPVTKLEKQLAPLQDIYDQAVLTSKALHDQGKDTTFVDKVANDALVKMNDLQIKAAENAKKVKKAVSGSGIAQSFIAEFKLIAGAPELATPEVLNSLDQLARKIKGKAPITGAAGQEMGKKLIDGLNAAIRAAVEGDNPQAAESLKALATRLANLFGVELGTAFKNVKVPLTEEDVLAALLPQRIRAARAEAFGTVDDQIAAKEDELKGLKARLGSVIKGSEDEEKLLGDISAKQDEIDSLRKNQAQEAKERRDKADKAVTDAIGKREQGFLNRLTEAQSSETLKDDIRRQLSLRAFYQQQIQVAKSSIQDKEARNDAVDGLEQKLFELDQDLAENRRNRRAQIRDKALEKIDDSIEKAEETETLKDDVQRARRKVAFWKHQVAVTKKLVRDRKATADELSEAEDALNDAEKDLNGKRRDRRQQIRDDRRSGLELDIDFAQTTENESAEIRARQKFIKFLEGQKKFVRGNVNKLKEIRNEIAAQQKAIDDIKGDVDKEKGTTVFELLKEAADTFRDNGGNLIGGNQPFAGPAGFTADLTNFLTRQALKAKDAIKETVAPPKRTKPKPLIGVESVVDPAVFETLSRVTEEVNKVKRLFTVGKPKGLIEPGNIDLLHRKVARNKDGSISTVKSFSIGTDKGETLIPQVVGGKVVSKEAAIKRFQRTGENLGTFSSIAAANAYAKVLHNEQAKFYARWMQSTANPLGTRASTDRQVQSTDRLTTALERLTNTIQRQPGEGKPTSPKKAVPAGAERSERTHFAVATATRRVVEERTGY
jgi:TP901 family phage tail tape measure protein